MLNVWPMLSMCHRAWLFAVIRYLEEYVHEQISIVKKASGRRVIIRL